MKRRRFLSFALVLPLSVAGVLGVTQARAETETYRTRGTVKHIAPDRTRLRIHHDEIPGFMKAMTMAFDASSALLVGIAEGDRVAFTFEARDDGSMVVVEITRIGPTSSGARAEVSSATGNSRK